MIERIDPRLVFALTEFDGLGTFVFVAATPERAAGPRAEEALAVLGA
ncbi:MAG TPA: hypothetical protein VK889_02075 [Solirubrobacterales bacterium]|nr:hypothetical protein [Solirubrobacterales bacterium]